MERGPLQIRIPEPVPDGLNIFETMRGQADGTIHLLSLHLARLRRGCAAVDFRFDSDRICAVIEDLTFDQPSRVRLAVDSAGDVSVVVQPLAPNPDCWNVGISDQRLDSADPWLRIKSTRRPVYEAARARLGANQDEVLLLNERGEICEGSITNLFVKGADGLMTPPVSSGVLPGILRQSLLEQGLARETVLFPEDLQGEFYVGNALRGLLKGKLVA